MTAVLFRYAGQNHFLPISIADRPIGEIGFSVKVTVALESAGVLKLRDLAEVDLDAIIAQCSTGESQFQRFITTLDRVVGTTTGCNSGNSRAV